MTSENSVQKFSSKLAQIATNIRFRWNRDSSLEKIHPGKPTTILGVEIPAIPDDPSLYRELIFEAVQRLPWSTYRSDFPLLRTSSKAFTSDVGWGCSIRVCQMLLLETLSRHLHIPWSENAFLLANFISEKGSNGVFALHKFIDVGERYMGKQAGDWLSPADVSHILCYLLAENQLVEGLHVYIASDSRLCKSEILADMTGLSPEDFTCQCTSVPETCPLCSAFMWQGSLLVLVPLMPGQKMVNRKYFTALKNVLTMRESVGIIGAKPGFALYFVGFQEDSLLYLDPHYVQKSARDDDHLQEILSTYQSPPLSSIPLSEVGSSMSLGFFFNSHSEFSAFTTAIQTRADDLGGLLSYSSTQRTESADLEFVD